MGKNPLPFLKVTPQGILLKVYIQPRSSKNQITGIYGDALKIKLTAPPIESAANDLCVKFLAKYLNLPKLRLQIISGKTSRNKQVLVRPGQGTSSAQESERIKERFLSALSPEKTA